MAKDNYNIIGNAMEILALLVALAILVQLNFSDFTRGLMIGMWSVIFVFKMFGHNLLFDNIKKSNE